MEVSRSKKTDKKFLKEIRKITKKKGICLIYDECTSGFRKHLEVFIKNMRSSQILLFTENQ